MQLTANTADFLKKIWEKAISGTNMQNKSDYSYTPFRYLL